jgi:glycolate oxidase iron-sulfur subunit
VPGSGCCGALDLHLGARHSAIKRARRNIDAWWPHIEGGVVAIVASSSGCGVTVREYGHLLRADPEYASKAARVSALFRDPVQLINQHWSSFEAMLIPLDHHSTIAFHPPCSLQHGLKITAAVEDLLKRSGYRVLPVRDAHLCCGSAGTYSILHPTVARKLRELKLAALEQYEPETIATANIGCMTHLQAGTRLPVLHWVEILDQRLKAV